MKKIYFFILILTANCAIAQSKDYLISKDGLGALKLGMSQTKVEQLLNKKLAMTKNYLDTVYGIYEDTAKVTYKNIPLQLEFQRNYNGPDTFYMRLIGIRGSSALCKTATGIGVGTDRLKIITDYDNYHINIQPGHATYYNTIKGKGKSTVSIFDNTANVFEDSNYYTTVFYMLNNKVLSFEIKGRLTGEIQ